jgi:hypothetical protein
MVSLTTVHLFGNGDPTTQLSALYASANPAPRDIVDVQVMSEKLYICPGYYSEVRVEYVLWNNSDKDYIDLEVNLFSCVRMTK